MQPPIRRTYGFTGTDACLYASGGLTPASKLSVPCAEWKPMIVVALAPGAAVLALLQKQPAAASLPRQIGASFAGACKAIAFSDCENISRATNSRRYQ
jgi:hypothetical protein